MFHNPVLLLSFSLLRYSVLYAYIIDQCILSNRTAIEYQKPFLMTFRRLENICRYTYQADIKSFLLVTFLWIGVSVFKLYYITDEK